MEQLKKAEAIDGFQERIEKDPINKLSRKGLHYTISSGDSQFEPWVLNTEIITMHSMAEAGMPHTRPPNLICMPAFFPESRRQETLIHELIHIDQRRRKEVWEAKFKREGWTPIAESEVPERWLRRCRLNPDTLDQRFYAWKGRYVPLPLFEREDKPELRAIQVRWWDQETGILQPQPPQSFIARYGTPSQPEHPRELAAVEVASTLKKLSDLDRYLEV
jgi:hypothetical protein